MPQWQLLDTEIVVIGVLCALACALLGNFLVLRRMSMMGDAISHAVLPGLVVGFMVTHSRASFVMFVGAAAVGLLTALFVQWLQQVSKVDRGAAMGVVFTTLFAIGLILMQQYAHEVHLDVDCVLYGAVELAPLDRVSLGWAGGVTVPRAMLVLSGVLLLNSLVVIVFFKELKISSFDPNLATTLGINARAMHYLLMALVAMTTVACFEAIGSILVIAMLIVPAAAAHLLTDRLAPMIVVSLVIGAVGAVVGHVGALIVPGWFGLDGTSTSGMMATVVGIIFAAVMILAPRHGLLTKALHRSALRMRIVREDVLGMLYRVEELRPGQSTGLTRVQIGEALSVSTRALRRALLTLTRRSMVERERDHITLTARGRKKARSTVRAHRLWESYLHKHLSLGADHVHAPAERLEHVTTDDMQRDLAHAVDDPTIDPHGKSVPESPH